MINSTHNPNKYNWEQDKGVFISYQSSMLQTQNHNVGTVMSTYNASLLEFLSLRDEAM